MSQSKNLSLLQKTTFANASKQATYCSSTLIWQRNLWQKTQTFTLFINLNESNILQVHSAKTTRTVLGIHFLILALNCNNVSVSFISRGSNSQILGPKRLKLSRPLWTDFTVVTTKSGLFSDSHVCCLFGRNNFLINSGFISFISLNISHARKRKFRLWSETESSSSSNL